MLGPTLSLWLYVAAVAIASALLNNDFGFSERAALLATVAFSLIIAWWVAADARKRGRALGYDYASMGFFFWPLLVPVYLFQTRGVRAFITLLCFVAIILAAVVAASVAALVQSALNSL
jgi:hypothetical protein